MLAEIITIGDEILLGQIVDTNSSWIGEQLAAHGISSHLQVKVGDSVLYGKYSGTEVSVSGEDLLIMRESDIYAIV